MCNNDHKHNLWEKESKILWCLIMDTYSSRNEINENSPKLQICSDNMVRKIDDTSHIDFLYTRYYYILLNLSYDFESGLQFNFQPDTGQNWVAVMMFSTLCIIINMVYGILLWIYTNVPSIVVLIYVPYEAV